MDNASTNLIPGDVIFVPFLRLKHKEAVKIKEEGWFGIDHKNTYRIVYEDDNALMKRINEYRRDKNFRIIGMEPINTRLDGSYHSGYSTVSLSQTNIGYKVIFEKL